MTATSTAPASRPAVAIGERARSAGRAERLIAGVGALGFATVVLATNAILGSTPAFDAPADEVVRFVTDNHDTLALSTAPFGLAMVFIVAFACAISGRLRAACRPEDQVWARMGVTGALLLVPSFAAVVVQRIVMTVGIDEPIGSPELVALGWRMEGAAFLLNTAVIGIALLGLGIAGSRSGLLPTWFRFPATAAAIASVVTACAAVAGLEGAPLMPLGLFGFGTWMAMLLTMGVRQLRAAD